MASVGELERFHRDLERRLSNLTRLHFTVKSGLQNWKGVVKGSTASFDMVCRECLAFAERKRGGRCGVFPLSQDPSALEDRVWAGWHEDWHCEGRGVFDLIGVGWTFFWGVDGRLRREQEVLRAEWDEVRATDNQTHRRAGFAAQPHWHLDTGMMSGYSRPVSRQAPAEEMKELEELSSGAQSALEEIGRSTEICELDLSGMHLGMGGWQNQGAHPDCWQARVCEDWASLVLWAERTLQSARDQFEELKIRK